MTPEFSEYDELIVRSLQGAATPDDERALARLRESAAFRRHHDATASLWALTVAERERRQAAMPIPDALQRKRMLRRSTGEFPVTRVRQTRRWLIAASLLVAVGGGVALREAGVGLPFRSDATAEYSTRDTETMTVTLEDGSLAHLAPRSRLRVVRSRSRRAIQLEGRAFFAVSRAAQQPLLVFTPRGIVEVTRGRFDVESTAEATRVVIVEGEVTMEATGGRVSSGAGHAMSATAATITSNAVTDLAARLAWMRGFLAFRNTPLRTVAQELQQLYGVKMDVAEDVGDRTVTAWFAHQRLEDVLAVVSRATYTQFKLDSGVVHIEPATEPARTTPRTAVGS
ncbi:MAG: FecR domain-containing protein [Gemmatimonadaceae bacterium]